MSQIHAVHNAANAVGTQAPNQPELSTQARTALRQRITDVVQRFEVLPYQERRLARTQGQQAAYVIGRVLGGIVTLGVSEGVIAIGHKAEKLNAQNLREQAVSRLTTAAYANEAIGRAVQSGAGFPSPAYESALEEAVAELRARFGTVLPEGAASLGDLPSARDVRSAVKAALAQMADEASPEQLKALVVEKGIPFMRNAALQQEIGRACEALGHTEADLADMAALLLERNSDLARALSDDVQGYGTASVLRAFRADIEAFAAHVTSFSASRKAAQDHAVAVLAEACGVSAEEMGLHLNLGKLNLQLDDAEPEMGTPEAAMRQACMEKADGLIRRKVELLRSADELEVSPGLKAYWKERVLADKTLNDPDTFRSAVAVASRVEEDKIAGIEELFRSGRPDADTAYAALHSLSLSVDIALKQVHDWRGLDGDKKGLARFHALKALLDRMPAFRTAFESDAALLADMEVRAGKDMASMDERVNIPAEVSESLVLALKTRSVDRAVLAASIGDPGKMPVPFLAALRQAEAAVRASYPDGLPADIMGMKLASGQTVAEAVAASVAGTEEAMTPAAFAGTLRAALNRAAAEACALDIVRLKAENTGVPLSEQGRADVLKGLLESNPGLPAELEAAENPAMAQRALADFEADIDALVFAGQSLVVQERSRNAAFEQAVDTLAANFGFSAGEVRERMAAQLENFAKALRQFQPAAQDGGAPALADLPGLYAAKAEEFAEKLTAAFYAVDGFGLSSQLATLWKDAVLVDSRASSADFLQNAVALARDISRTMGHLGPLMNNVGDAEGFYAALSSLGLYMERRGVALAGAEMWGRLGPDGQSDLFHFSMQVLLDMAPDLRQAMSAKPSFLAELRQQADKVMQKNSGAGVDKARNFKSAVRTFRLIEAFDAAFADNARLAAGVGKPEDLPAAYLQALRQAEVEVRNRFPGVALPADFMQAYPFSGPKLSNLLREAVENSGGALSPEGFGQMALRLMNRVAADAVVRQTVAERLEQVDVEGTRAFTHRENVNDALLALFKRHPELVEALSGASGPQAVRDALAGLDDFAPMLRFLADASRAWVAGERYLYRRMAEATGLPETDVRERLNTAGILRGSAFHYQRSDWIDILKDPAQSLAVLPSAEEMIQLYEGMAERFASRKGALYQSVDGLPGLSADYRAELKEAVLKRSELKLPFFFERCSRTAQGMYAAPLLRAIEAGEDDSVLLDAVRRLAVQYDSASHVTFSPTTLAGMGSDELSSIQSYSLGMFMDLNPALRGRLAPERGNALMDQMEEEMSLIGREFSRVRPETPAYVQAQARYGQAATVIALLNDMTRQG